MKIYSTLTSIIVAVNLFAQQQYTPDRYRHAIFNQVTVQNDVQYGSAPQWVWPYWNETLRLDVYQPTGDVVTNRPLIIFAHAGGFLNGSKGVDNMIAICDSFARKGYVTASLDYRKGFNPLDGQSAERAVYRGIQDGKAAVRYFKENAALYGIDTNYVYFGGMSAGGFMAVHVAYMDLESERPASTYGGGTVNNLGCLDCSGNSFTHTSNVRAVLNYWGAIQDTLNIIAGDVPIMQMHGTDDPTVPYAYGQPFGLFTLPYVYGSAPIRERMDNLGIYNEFYTSNAPGRHMLDGSDNGTFSGNSPNSFWYDTLLPRTTDFLVLMTKSHPVKISQDTLIVCSGDTTHLKISGNTDSYFEWSYLSESTYIGIGNHTDSLKYVFTESGEYNIAVIEFNEVYCSSDTLWFHIIQQPELAPVHLTQDTFVLCPGELADMKVSGNENSQYTWTLFAYSSSIPVNNSSDSLSMVFTADGEFDIAVVELSEAGCSSDTLWFHIIRLPEIIADFNYQITDLSDVLFINNSVHSTTYQWDFGDGATSTEYQPEHTYIQNGAYMVTLTATDENGCSKTTTQTVVISGLSVNNLTEMGIGVFPNPFEDVIHLSNELNQEMTVEVSDVNGKIMLGIFTIGASSTLTIDTHEWTQGMYFIHITSNGGEDRMVKVVK